MLAIVQFKKKKKKKYNFKKCGDLATQSLSE